MTLNIKDLVKTFDLPAGGGSLTVLDVPSFEIADAEQVVMIGESGGGKTCLLYTSPSPRDQRGSRMPSSA